MSEIEDWRSVPGYEGVYDVSNMGRVRSLGRTVIRCNGSPNKVQGRILKDREHTGGYRMVSLAMNAEYGHFLVHRLVAVAFIGECPGGHEVAHWDGNKANNSLANLRYATTKENSGDSVRLGVMKHGVEHHFAKLKDADVIAIRTATGSQSKIAKQFGVSQTLVSQILSRKIWRRLA